MSLIVSESEQRDMTKAVRYSNQPILNRVNLYAFDHHFEPIELAELPERVVGTLVREIQRLQKKKMENDFCP